MDKLGGKGGGGGYYSGFLLVSCDTKSFDQNTFWSISQRNCIFSFLKYWKKHIVYIRIRSTCMHPSLVSLFPQRASTWPALPTLPGSASAVLASHVASAGASSCFVFSKFILREAKRVVDSRRYYKLNPVRDKQ